MALISYYGLLLLSLPFGWVGVRSAGPSRAAALLAAAAGLCAVGYELWTVFVRMPPTDRSDIPAVSLALFLIYGLAITVLKRAGAAVEAMLFGLTLVVLLALLMLSWFAA